MKAKKCKTTNEDNFNDIRVHLQPRGQNVQVHTPIIYFFHTKQTKYFKQIMAK